YAVWWIRQSIMQALDNNSRLVRIPGNKINSLTKISRAEAAVEQQFERQPTEQELADFMGVDISEIKSANTASIKQSSLDAPFAEGEDNSLLDILNNPDAESVDDSLVNQSSLYTELTRLM